MAGNLKKFINPRFLKTIDLELMHALFARHAGDGGLPVEFGAEPAAVRAALGDYFDVPVSGWAEGLVADLHRIAELGTGDGLRLILTEARRRGVTLDPLPQGDEADPAPLRHEPTRRRTGADCGELGRRKAR